MLFACGRFEERFVPGRYWSVILNATYGLFGIGSSCLVIWYVSDSILGYCMPNGWVGRRTSRNECVQTIGQKDDVVRLVCT